MSSSSPNFTTSDGFLQSPPGSFPAIPFESEYNGPLLWNGSESHELLLPGPAVFPLQDGSPLTTKLETEFDAPVSGASFDDKQKAEFGVDSNWLGDLNTSADEVKAWQTSGDLMEVVLADSAEFGLGIRLDDDIFIEANKESALSIFEVVTICIH